MAPADRLLLLLRALAQKRRLQLLLTAARSSSKRTEGDLGVLHGQPAGVVPLRVVKAGLGADLRRKARAAGRRRPVAAPRRGSAQQQQL
jgi:hypothetical protein